MIPPTMGSFYNHISHIFHQLRQCATTGEGLIDVRDPLEYGWEENNGNYIPAVTANAFTPKFLIELISCNSKKYCKYLVPVIWMGNRSPSPKEFQTEKRSVVKYFLIPNTKEYQRTSNIKRPASRVQNIFWFIIGYLMKQNVETRLA